MSWAAQFAIACAVFIAGAMGGVKYQLGVQGRKDVVAIEARATDSRRQLRIIDTASTAHLTELRTINKKLGDARAHIATLSSRPCLSEPTVSLLNSIGDQPVRTATGESESAPGAPAVAGGIRFATERDTAQQIAVCRAGYAELSSQVNSILDIEDARQRQHIQRLAPHSLASP